MSRSVNRRRFLQQSSAVAAGYWVHSSLAAAPSQSANEKLDIAAVGVGGRGGANLQQFKAENVVGLCDIDDTYLGKAEKQHSKAKKYTDFRRMYDDAKNFDAVVVSCAEHTHAFATLPALQLKKHVYCEKPLTHGVWEARVIAEAARKAGVATQLGTQLHGSDNYRRIVEHIQSGIIGPVKECHIWVSRAWGWQTPEEAKIHKDIVNVQDRPLDAKTPPPTLHFDQWLGPAPERPYHDIYFPGPKWYRWWDFGGGTMSDLGAHWIDLAFWSLKLTAPVAVESEGPPPHPEIAPASLVARFEFPAREDLPPCKLAWYQGKYKPPPYEDGTIPKWGNGHLFVGEKGMLLSDYSKFILLPESKFKDVKRPEPFIPNSIGHHAEWVKACKTGSPTLANFEYAGPMTESNHLGNVAFRVGRRIEWDSANLRITNCPEAERIVRREYRKGWSLA